nr:oxidoreductase [Pseudomonadota bacterium]
ALGSKEYPKERMEIFADGLVITMDDYKRLEVSGRNQKGWSANTVQKGHQEELQFLSRALLLGAEWPISYEQLRLATWLSFEVERQLY